ncbi:hypothetical protein NKG05_26090 [Oerskovia sp. M15]
MSRKTSTRPEKIDEWGTRHRADCPMLSETFVLAAEHGWAWARCVDCDRVRLARAQRKIRADEGGLR